MALSDNYSPSVAVGNGVTTDFDWDWDCLSSAYVEVYLEEIATGIQTLQTLTTDYTIATEVDGSGTVTMVTAPASTHNVIISRATPRTQETPYKTSSGYQGSVLEDTVDKLTSVDQEQQDELDRALKLALGTTGVSGTLPAPSAGKILKWNDDEDAIENSTNSIANLETYGETINDNIASITSVASSISNVNTVATDIANVNLVGGSIANVNLVGGSIANVNTVAGSIANVNTVAGSIANVNTVATNIASVIDAANNIPKANRTATVDPAVDDDDADGYSAGSMWINTTDDAVWVCTDASTGAAVWTKLELPTIASQAEAEAGTENTKMMTPLRTAEAIAALVGGTVLQTQHFTNTSATSSSSTTFATFATHSFTPVSETSILIVHGIQSVDYDWRSTTGNATPVVGLFYDGTQYGQVLSSSSASSTGARHVIPLAYSAIIDHDSTGANDFTLQLKSVTGTSKLHNNSTGGFDGNGFTVIEVEI